MSEDTTQNQVVTQYLLGALSKSETERLDELSFTDDEFAESLQSAEKDLVDAYVQGQLSETQLDRFNSYYLSTPLRREKAAFARALQKLGEKESPVTATASTRTKRRWLLVLESWWSPRLAWGLATATLVLLIGGGVLLFQNVRLRQQIRETQARREALLQRERELQAELSHERTSSLETRNELTRLREEMARLENERGVAQPSPDRISPIFSFMLRPPVRGGGNVPSFTIPAKTQTVSIQLGLESTDASSYRVTLTDASGRELWRSGALGARVKTSLTISFPASLLKSQVYVAQVSGVKENGTSEIIGDYAFRVLR